ncbi:MAG: amidase [Gammaproteobacteria bacterium]|nr:amidase [Gammaproteobacteria bacterium]
MLRTLHCTAVLLISSIIISCSHTTQTAASELEVITRSQNILELQELMQQEQLSAVALVEFYLAKIEQQDQRYRSIITINPAARQQAKQLDAERRNGKIRSPLHGIPIIVKDNIETIEMPTTAGSLVLKDNVTNRDATLIANLRQAGAIILAKANLSEWANIRSERSSSGWSAVGGQTRNPLALNRSPCGSSSGSAVAVAANFAVAAIGTETNGSITCPASVTGVVGIKPTVGLVSRHRIVPISHTQDTAGPMAKSVIDAALLLQYMSSADQADEQTLDDSFDRTQKLAPAPQNLITTMRLGLVQSAATRHEAVATLEHQLSEKLAAKQWLAARDLAHSPYRNFWSDTYTVLLYQLKHDLNRYLSQLPPSHSQLTLEKIIAFNQQYHQQEMPFFQQEIFVKAQQKGPLTENDYQNALTRITQETQTSLDRMLSNQKLDALIAITRGPAWSIDRVNGDNTVGGVSTYSAVAGYPHITIPLGKVHGLPIGLSIMGRKGDERRLIALAYSLEQWLTTQSFNYGQPIDVTNN